MVMLYTEILTSCISNLQTLVSTYYVSQFSSYCSTNTYDIDTFSATSLPHSKIFKKKLIFPCKSVDYFVSLQNKGYKSYLISTIVDIRKKVNKWYGL